MKRALVALVVASGLLISTGCASKKYVRQQTEPIINKTNELDDLTARNTRDIRDLDARAQQGIQSVNAKSEAAAQKASSARQTADQAQTMASTAAQRADALHQAVVNLDNYRPVVETAVHFGFDQANLTAKAKEALDQLAAEIPNTRHYIISVEGGADSTGDSSYNYQLSERRAASVIQYLASEHSIPAHKIYVIGLGEDKTVASNASRDGRAKNRRVEVRLLTNTVEQEQPTTAANGTPTGK